MMTIMSLLHVAFLTVADLRKHAVAAEHDELLPL